MSGSIAYAKGAAAGPQLAAIHQEQLTVLIRVEKCLECAWGHLWKERWIEIRILAEVKPAFSKLC